MTDLHLAVFDVDGTLVDSQEAIVQSMTQAFRHVGYADPDRPEVLSVIGLSLPVAIARLAPDLDEATVAAASEAYKRAFVASRLAGGAEAGAPLYAGAREALERLSRRGNLLMGVATGKARRGLDHVYASHGLGGYFVTHQTADLHPSKPHPAMLHAALAETGIEAVRAVMIGDTVYDIEMGRAAGVRTIGVTWGYHPAADLEAAGADLLISAWDEMDAALDRVLGRE